MERLSIQDVAAVLVKKNGLKKREAEQFVTAMFDIVKEGLLADKIVKVRGLGTFKVVDIDARESVNINNGERMLIEGHERITFTPDATMKELVNKPFSIFETVILNDGVQFDDMLPGAQKQSENDDSEDEQETAEQEMEVAEDEQDELEELVIIDQPVETGETEAPETPEEPAGLMEQTESVESEKSEETVETVEPEDTVELVEQAVSASIKPLKSEEPEKLETLEEQEKPIEQGEIETSEDTTDRDNAADSTGSDDAMNSTDSDNAADSGDSEDSESLVDDEEYLEETEEEYMSKKMTYIALVVAILACVLSFVAGYYYRDNIAKSDVAEDLTADSIQTAGDNKTAVLAADSVQADSIVKYEAEQTVKQEVEQKEEPVSKPASETPSKPEAMTETKSEPQQEPASAGLDKYQQMDKRVRYGAYRIVGQASVVMAKEGDNVGKIARRILGPDMECYVEVFNGINASTPLKAGQEIKIPKIELKKKRRK